MLQYFTKRALMIIPIILGVILLIFLLMYNLPSSSLSRMTAYGDGDALDRFFEFTGLGDNFVTKYIRYCYNVFVHFDFGRDARAIKGIGSEILFRFRQTATLAGLSITVTLIVGVSLGIYAAIHKNGWQDNILTFISLLFSSIPSHCIALFYIVLFVVLIPLVPLLGYTRPINYVLPTLTLASSGIATVARMTRASMLEVLDQPYITALRSKGLKERIVVYRHALKNSLVPIISVMGGLISQLLCGALVVEYFFTIPGIGSYLLGAVSSRAHYTILACSVVLSVILSVITLLSDMLYALVDPKIRLQYIQKSERKVSGKERTK